MGTYLYFGKISKTKTDAKIVISESGSFRPVENVDCTDYFFGRIPSLLIPKEMEYQSLCPLKFYDYKEDKKYNEDIKTIKDFIEFKKLNYPDFYQESLLNNKNN